MTLKVLVGLSHGAPPLQPEWITQLHNERRTTQTSKHTQHAHAHNSHHLPQMDEAYIQLKPAYKDIISKQWLRKLQNHIETNQQHQQNETKASDFIPALISHEKRLFTGYDVVLGWDDRIAEHRLAAHEIRQLMSHLGAHRVYTFDDSTRIHRLEEELKYQQALLANNYVRKKRKRTLSQAQAHESMTCTVPQTNIETILLVPQSKRHTSCALFIQKYAQLIQIITIEQLKENLIQHCNETLS